MKFTDGHWLPRPGVEMLHPRQVVDVDITPETLVVHAATTPLHSRGDTLSRALLKVTFTAPADGVIGVRVDHHTGGCPSHPYSPCGGPRRTSP